MPTVTNVARNIQNGSLVIKDGSATPKSCTVACSGNLKWSESRTMVEVLCRGSVDHRREGNTVGFTVSFDAAWYQLISKTANSGDAVSVYEILSNPGSYFTSTEDGAYCLDIEFTVADPNTTNGNDEKITFPDVFIEKVDCSEGEDKNMIAFSGRGKVRAPTITRV
jgi:hypothetical protein